MGGSGIAISEREAASALRWWLESGVDCAIQESPRDWLERQVAAAAPVVDTQQVPAPPAALPDTLDAFRDWLSTSVDAPLFARSKPVLPEGAEQAEVMILAEPPGREDVAGGRPVTGDSAALLQRMLAAIGMNDSFYCANLACFHLPGGGRLTPAQLEECANAARHHIALARPKRLLVLGDVPSRAILGKPLLQARGHVHTIEGVRTVATFHPRQLLKRPSDKALAWKDLLLLTEDDK